MSGLQVVKGYQIFLKKKPRCNQLLTLLLMTLMAKKSAGKNECSSLAGRTVPVLPVHEHSGDMVSTQAFLFQPINLR